MRVCCIQHVPFEDAGEIAAWAAERGHRFEVTQALAEAFPSPDDLDWLVVMGGPMGADEERHNQWLIPEKALIRNAVKSGKRVLGVCLGAQLIADALGAAVTRNREVEIGWFPVSTLTSEPPFDALPREFTPLHWHGDTFALPEGAVHAARSEACENQAFSVAGGIVVGLQFHLECTTAGVARLVESCSEELVGGPWIQQPGELLGAEAHFVEARTALFALLDRMASL